MSYISKGRELTDSEISTVQAIDGGGYFVYNETPTGTIDSSNVTFTLANTPNPATSLQITIQGQLQIQGSDYTLSGNTITMTTAPVTGVELKAVFYTVAP